MRLTTWNVNGIRNPFSYQPWNTARTFPAMFDTLGSDIVVMQELKIQRKDLQDDMVLLDGWDAYFSLPKHKKGYSGVGIYTRNVTCAPIRAEEGILGVLSNSAGTAYCDLPGEQSIGGYPTAEQVEALGVDPMTLDAEGRCVVLEFQAFVLFGVYSPANSNGLRDDFRYGFICALDCRIRNLVKSGKRVVLVGDLNVSRDEMDSAGAVEDCKKAGLTHEQYISTPNRRIFNQLLVGGEVAGERDEGREHGVLWDTCRGFHPDRKGMFTHWEQKINARPGNYGSRIDFVLVDASMQTWIKDANIQEGLLGSDHCPVYADFNETICIDDEEMSMVDMMSPPGVFVNGVRQQEWQLSNVPAFSAKRMPEFDKRRNIKSMFLKKSESSAGDSATSNRDKPEISSTAETNSEDATISRNTLATNAAVRPEQLPRPTSPKRKLSAPVKEKSVKKQKANNGSQPSKGQQSLKGFFSASNKTVDAISPNKSVDNKSTHDEKRDGSIAAALAPMADDRTPPPSPSPAATTTKTPTSGHAATSTQSTASPARTTSPTPDELSAQIAQAEQSQRSWNALFTKPAAPLCEGHNEPCKTMQTKKKGSNQGRSFWMCARPLGPSGEKEKNTAWRCGTFIWCSEWKPG